MTMSSGVVVVNYCYYVVIVVSNGNVVASKFVSIE